MESSGIDFDSMMFGAVAIIALLIGYNLLMGDVQMEVIRTMQRRENDLTQLERWRKEYATANNADSTDRTRAEGMERTRSFRATPHRD